MTEYKQSVSGTVCDDVQENIDTLRSSIQEARTRMKNTTAAVDIELQAIQTLLNDAMTAAEWIAEWYKAIIYTERIIPSGKDDDR